MRMRHYFFFSMLLFFQVQFAAAQHEGKTITVTRITKLKAIPEQIRDTMFSHELLMKYAPSAGHIDGLFFENIRVGKIQQCKLRYDFKKTCCKKFLYT